MARKSSSLTMRPVLRRMDPRQRRKAAATRDNWDVFKNETALRAQSAKAVAGKYGLVFVPLQATFDALCEKAEPSYWLYDGVHPPAMGHQVIADALCAAVSEAL